MNTVNKPMGYMPPNINLDERDAFRKKKANLYHETFASTYGPTLYFITCQQDH